MKPETFNKIFVLVVLLAIIGLVFLGAFKVIDKGAVEDYVHLLLAVLVAIGAVGAGMAIKKANGKK